MDERFRTSSDSYVPATPGAHAGRMQEQARRSKAWQGPVIKMSRGLRNDTKKWSSQASSSSSCAETDFSLEVSILQPRALPGIVGGDLTRKVQFSIGVTLVLVSIFEQIRS